MIARHASSAGIGVIAAGLLAGCVYQPPPAYSYYLVPCAPAAVAGAAPTAEIPFSGSSQPPALPPGGGQVAGAATAPGGSMAAANECVAAVPNYASGAYYGGYQYPYEDPSLGYWDPSGDYWGGPFLGAGAGWWGGGVYGGGFYGRGFGRGRGGGRGGGGRGGGHGGGGHGR